MNSQIGLTGLSGVGSPISVGAKKAFDPVPENATPSQKAELAKLKKQAVEYESLFMKEVVSAMRKSVPKDDGSGDAGNSMEIYNSMMDDQLAGNMAQKGTSGISQELYNKLAKTCLSLQAAKNGGAK